MTTGQFLRQGWYWDTFSAAVCLLAVAAGLFVTQRRADRDRDRGGLGRAAVGWWAAVAVLGLALLSPLTTLARQYLFSAHMLQHLLLVLVAPALFLVGCTTANGSAHSGTPPVRKGRRSAVLVGWTAGVGTMWLWHVPALCEASTRWTWVYHLQVATLLAAGWLFWRPVLASYAGRGITPLAGVTYLVSACLGCTLLGIYLTFSPVAVCPLYLHPADPLGVLPLIRGRWAIAPEMDQQAGGLIMWVPGCVIYITGVLALLTRWFQASGADWYEPRTSPGSRLKEAAP